MIVINYCDRQSQNFLQNYLLCPLLLLCPCHTASIVSEDTLFDLTWVHLLGLGRSIRKSFGRNYLPQANRRNQSQDSAGSTKAPNGSEKPIQMSYMPLLSFSSRFQRWDWNANCNRELGRTRRYGERGQNTRVQ